METKDKIELILKKIMFAKSSHNEIYYQHFRTFLRILLEDETHEWKTVKYKCSASIGVGDRYIKTYLKGLIAWNILDLDEEDKIVMIMKFDK